MFREYITFLYVLKGTDVGNEVVLKVTILVDYLGLFQVHNVSSFPSFIHVTCIRLIQIFSRSSIRDSL